MGLKEYRQQLRITKTMIAVMHSSDSDLILLYSLCQLETENRMLKEGNKIDYLSEISKMKNIIKNSNNKQ